MTLRIHEQTHYKNDFIRGWYLDNDSLCDDLINYFENSDTKSQGVVHSTAHIDKSIKDSTDCDLNYSDEIAHLYFSNLQKAVDEYVQIYPYVNMFTEWRIIEGTNIQKYDPNKAYFGWHTERASAKHPNSSRHLVFMTFLNDVHQGGETEFFHQKIKVRPQKGLTLLWPADWTFVHRGCPAPVETKYIVTGWFNYIDHQGE